jgi:histidine triad (HIT) family protein
MEDEMTDEQECIFCRIAAGEFGTKLLYESDSVLAFEDLSPQAATHVLVIPRRHLASAADLRAEDGELLAEMVMAANGIAKARGIDASGYRLLTNVGADAGQTVMHLHLHLLGGNELGPLA